MSLLSIILPPTEKSKIKSLGNLSREQRSRSPLIISGDIVSFTSFLTENIYRSPPINAGSIT